MKLEMPRNQTVLICFFNFGLLANAGLHNCL